MQLTYPPPINASSNVSRIADLVASGVVSKLAGYANLYTTTLAPGLLLFKLNAWEQVMKGQGTLVIHETGLNVLSCSYCIEADAPAFTPQCVVSPTGMVFKYDLVFGPTLGIHQGVKEVTKNQYNYNYAKSTIFKASTIEMYSGKLVASTRAPIAFFGVITGASQGSHYSIEGVANLRHCIYNRQVNSWVEVDTVLPGTFGELTTGAYESIGALIQRKRAVLLDGVPSAALAAYGEAIDEVIANHWASSKFICLGASVQSTCSGGPVSYGEVGYANHTQQFLGLIGPTWKIYEKTGNPITGTIEDIVEVEGDPYAYLIEVPPVDHPTKAYINFNRRFSLDAISFMKVADGVMDDIFLKAMFVGRPDLNAAIPGVFSPGIAEPVRPSLALIEEVVDAESFADYSSKQEPEFDHLDAFMAEEYGSVQKIPAKSTLSVLVNTVRRINKLAMEKI